MSSPSNVTSLPQRTVGSLKRTFPFVKSVIKNSKGVLLGLAILSIALGIVPTLKSELESGILDQINSHLRQDRVDSNVFQTPMTRFTTGRQAGDTDLSEDIAKSLFRGITLWQALLYYLFIGLIGYLAAVYVKKLQTLVSREVFSKIRGEAFRKGLEVDPSAIKSMANAPGQYASAIQQGATNFWGTYGYMLEAGQHIFSLLTIIILVATKSWVFALSCVFVVFLQTVISVIQARRLKKSRNALDTERNALLGQTDDILSKREIILVHEQQKRYKEKLDDLTNKFANIDRNIEIKREWFQGFSNLLTDYGRILIPVFALLVALRYGGTAISSIGDVYFLISIYTRMLVPASNLLSRYDDIKSSEASSQTFLDVLASPEKKEVPAVLTVPSSIPVEDAISFDSVYFKYKEDEDAPWILRNCSFKVPVKKTTLVLGRSGSGKSTISRIILGFWPITTGRVFVAGREIREWDTVELRKLMGYVAQGDYIVDENVRENLSWGYSSDGKPITQQDMVEALQTMRIGGSEILDKEAKNLSIGQQQRLSFARLLLDESPIVILDEPFSGVDVFTIRELTECLHDEFTGNRRTVLMFSHRLAFAAYADHIIVLGQDGGIEEQGSPEELKNRGGEFAKLHSAAVKELTGEERPV